MVNITPNPPTEIPLPAPLYSIFLFYLSVIQLIMTIGKRSFNMHHKTYIYFKGDGKIYT